MGYFRELPNLDYQSFLPSSNSSQNYIRVKNLFRRCKLRDDLQNVFTLFNKYEIRDGARPDTVAEELFGSAELDWVVLMTAGITNVRNEWPLSDRELYDYALEIYGDALNNIHHYETTEILDEDNRTVLPEGLEVDKDFQYSYYGTNSTITTNPVVPVTNYQYESKRNDEKRKIVLLKPTMVGVFISDMKNMMKYK